VVLSSRLLSTCPQPKCKPANQLANTTTGLKGGTPDISHMLMMLMFYWFEPETTEKPGFFVGFADNVGAALTFKILKNDLSAVLHRSVVRPAADPTHRNKRVTFKRDTQEVLEKLDTIPGVATHRDSQPKQRSSKSNDDISNRTRSKAGHINQNIGDRTRSKVQFIHNSGFQGNVFPLFDAVNFEDKKKELKVNLQLGSTECKTYQSILMEPKLQCQLDHLRQLHILDKIEGDHDRSWECSKVLKYSEEKTVDGSVDHKCLVEWNDLNKSQSWVNFFALCLSNPTPVISFAKEHQLLDKPPFYNLIPYCKSKLSTNVSKACNVLSNPTTVKYKFGIQVPRGIRNAISLDKGTKIVSGKKQLKQNLSNLQIMRHS
jgi:hypothetical protein